MTDQDYDYLLDDDDDRVDPEEEARRDEEGARLGDPRRCPTHPQVVTSSPDGMFDGLCWICESGMEEEEPPNLDNGVSSAVDPSPTAEDYPGQRIDGSDDDIPF